MKCSSSDLSGFRPERWLGDLGVVRVAELTALVTNSPLRIAYSDNPSHT